MLVARGAPAADVDNDLHETDFLNEIIVSGVQSNIKSLINGMQGKLYFVHSTSLHSLTYSSDALMNAVNATTQGTATRSHPRSVLTKTCTIRHLEHHAQDIFRSQLLFGVQGSAELDPPTLCSPKQPRRLEKRIVRHE